MTDDRRLRTADDLDTDALESVVREVVILLGLGGFLLLGTTLPGRDWVLFDPGLTVGDVVLGAGTLGIVGTLLYAAPKVGRLLRSVLVGPNAVVRHTAAIGTYLVGFLAVLVGFWGFEPVLRPLLSPAWLYELTFLSLALLLLGVVAYRFAQAVDPITTFVVHQLWEDDEETEPRYSLTSSQDRS